MGDLIYSLFIVSLLIIFVISVRAAYFNYSVSAKLMDLKKLYEEDYRYYLVWEDYRYQVIKKYDLPEESILLLSGEILLPSDKVVRMESVLSFNSYFSIKLTEKKI